MPAWRAHAGALFVYALLAVVLTWPLSLHLSTHLTGTVGGDTGVYVWNQWVFRHELLENRSLPYFTGTIFSLAPRANLSLHNYTTFANVLALPMMGVFGVVATFNIVYLLLMVASAYAMFLLARHVTSGGTGEAILAGILFAWSPVLVTRGGGHFSLVAAAPLPIFALALVRARKQWRVRDAALLGGVMAWAATSDVYYAVFCLLIAAAVLGARVHLVRRSAAATRLAMAKRATEIAMICVAGLVVALVIGRGWRFTFLGTNVSMRGLYTPVFALTVLAVLRLGLQYRPEPLRLHVTRAQVLRVLCLGLVAASAAALLLSPVLYALGQRLLQHGADGEPTLWRSSPRGVDLAALVLPNPNHPLAPDATRAWLALLPQAYLENVASVPLVAMAVLLLAWRAGWRVPRVWGAVAVLFGLLALGPFVHVAGVNTYVPGPWALLRYVPIIGLVRTPARFSVVMVLGIATLFALALCALRARYPRHATALLAGVSLVLIGELLPVPRPLYAAHVPAFYGLIAADARADVRVLELPFGFRDGTTSVGNFTARSQFYQTTHHKPLIGGYLSRISRKRIRDMQRVPVLGALARLSSNRALPPEARQRLLERGAEFLRRAKVGYVVIDHHRASKELVCLAIRAFHLEPVAREGDLELYRPVL
ncbi:MAG: hypothetical protein ACRD26_03615 [Vicinamibacterales bacterium]